MLKFRFVIGGNVKYCAAATPGREAAAASDTKRWRARARTPRNLVIGPGAEKTLSHGLGQHRRGRRASRHADLVAGARLVVISIGVPDGGRDRATQALDAPRPRVATLPANDQ